MFETFMQVSQVSASWAAAIGTTFAACVALWLGLGDRRRRDSDRKVMAETMRSMIGFELVGVIATLVKVPMFMDTLKGDYFGDDDGEAAVYTIRFMANRLSIPIAEASKHHFVHLPIAEAVLVSALVGDLPNLKRSFEQWANRYHEYSVRQNEIIEGVLERSQQIVLAIEALGWTE